MDEQARRRTLDFAGLARAQVRAGLPVSACPYCGGPPGVTSHLGGGLCCCVDCYKTTRDPAGGGCLEYPHRKDEETP